MWKEAESPGGHTIPPNNVTCLKTLDSKPRLPPGNFQGWDTLYPEKAHASPHQPGSEEVSSSGAWLWEGALPTWPP